MEQIRARALAVRARGDASGGFAKQTRGTTAPVAEERPGAPRAATGACEVPAPLQKRSDVIARLEAKRGHLVVWG